METHSSSTPDTDGNLPQRADQTGRTDYGNRTKVKVKIRSPRRSAPVSSTSCTTKEFQSQAILLKWACRLEDRQERKHIHIWRGKNLTRSRKGKRVSAGTQRNYGCHSQSDHCKGRCGRTNFCHTQLKINTTVSGLPTPWCCLLKHA